MLCIEVIEILESGGRDDLNFLALCTEIVKQCPICARSGQPVPSWKASLKYIQQALDIEVQSGLILVVI